MERVLHRSCFVDGVLELRYRRMTWMRPTQVGSERNGLVQYRRITEEEARDTCLIPPTPVMEKEMREIRDMVATVDGKVDALQEMFRHWSDTTDCNIQEMFDRICGFLGRQPFKLARPSEAQTSQAPGVQERPQDGAVLGADGGNERDED